MESRRVFFRGSTVSSFWAKYNDSPTGKTLYMREIVYLLNYLSGDFSRFFVPDGPIENLGHFHARRCPKLTSPGVILQPHFRVSSRSPKRLLGGSSQLLSGDRINPIFSAIKFGHLERGSLNNPNPLGTYLLTMANARAYLWTSMGFQR